MLNIDFRDGELSFYLFTLLKNIISVEDKIWTNLPFSLKNAYKTKELQVFFYDVVIQIGMILHSCFSI